VRVSRTRRAGRPHQPRTGARERPETRRRSRARDEHRLRDRQNRLPNAAALMPARSRSSSVTTSRRPHPSLRSLRTWPTPAPKHPARNAHELAFENAGRSLTRIVSTNEQREPDLDGDLERPSRVHQPSRRSLTPRAPNRPPRTATDLPVPLSGTGRPFGARDRFTFSSARVSDTGRARMCRRMSASWLSAPPAWRAAAARIGERSAAKLADVGARRAAARARCPSRAPAAGYAPARALIEAVLPNEPPQRSPET
jgi:hypothetical protein